MSNDAIEIVIGYNLVFKSFTNVEKIYGLPVFLNTEKGKAFVKCFDPLSGKFEHNALLSSYTKEFVELDNPLVLHKEKNEVVMIIETEDYLQLLEYDLYVRELCKDVNWAYDNKCIEHVYEHSQALFSLSFRKRVTDLLKSKYVRIPSLLITEVNHEPIALKTLFSFYVIISRYLDTAIFKEYFLKKTGEDLYCIGGYYTKPISELEAECASNDVINLVDFIYPKHKKYKLNYLRTHKSLHNSSPLLAMHIEPVSYSFAVESYEVSQQLVELANED